MDYAEGRLRVYGIRCVSVRRNRTKRQLERRQAKGLCGLGDVGFVMFVRPGRLILPADEA